MTTTWLGEMECDFCGTRPESGFMYDGATERGPWAFMCEPCFKLHGIGVGQGVGQKYAVITKEKVAG